MVPLDVTRPPVMRGELPVPLALGVREFERRRTVTDRAGIMIVSSDASKVVIAIGSGQYRFSTA